MPSELKRGVIRLTSNYTRLVIKFALAVGFVPILLIGVGSEGFGLIALLGSTMGIAEMCRAIIRDSMRRELGAAYHSENPEDFPNAYNASLAIAAVLMLVTAVLFLIIFSVLPLLRIPEELLGAAQWLVGAKGVVAVLVVLFGPAFNMYAVTERFVLHNLWSTLERLSDFLAAVFLFIVLAMRDPSSGIIAFAIISSGAAIVVQVIAVANMVRLDRRLIPEPSRISYAEIRKILPTAGWNTAVTTAMNLHVRLDQFIMNYFGLTANAAFGVALRLTSYGRVAAMGSTQGIEVVSTRLTTTGKGISVAELTGHSTRLHAAIALPATLVVFILAEPILTAWLGWIGRLTDDPSLLPTAVALSRILVLGMAARAINESWQRILYGAGFVHKYGPWVLLGGVFNPITALLLIWLLPDSVAYQGPAWAYTAVMVVLNFIWMPQIAARCLSVSVRDVLAPLWRPAVGAFAVAPVLLIPAGLGREDSLPLVAAVMAAYGGLYILICWFYVLLPPERTRFTGAITRRLGFARPAPGS